MNSRNYNQEFKETIKEIENSGVKPTLFLHACCGPCLAYPLSILLPHFNLTIGFINPNIQPLSEYQKRLFNLEKLIQGYVRDHKEQVRVVLMNEDFDKYNELFKDRESDFEGGQVCLRCHAYRMNLSYKYACLHHYDYFTTVMTVSCKKPSRELNEIGIRLSEVYKNTKYLYSDFKKEDGQLKGIRISNSYDIYRQNYCGCLVSLKEREKQTKEKENLVG